MSGLFKRTAKQRPAQVQELEAAHGRALAWGLTSASEPVLATIDALVIGGPEVRCMPWHLVDRAVWEPPVFTIAYRDRATGARRRLQLHLAERGELPPVVRERVTRSVVISRRVALDGELGAVLAARRDAAGAVSWTVTFDAGLDPRDPELQQRARAELAELRRSYGA